MRRSARVPWKKGPTSLTVIPPSSRGLTLPRSFRIPRLVQLHLEAAGYPEVRHQPVAVVLDLLHELHAPAAQVGDRGGDVVAVERDVAGARGRLGPLGGMDAEVRLGRIEDQPAAADVGTFQA